MSERSAHRSFSQGFRRQVSAESSGPASLSTGGGPGTVPILCAHAGPAESRAIPTLRIEGSEGFTIMDSLVATFLLAVAIISAAGVIMFAISQGVANNRAASATIVAQQELESVRDLSYTAIVSRTRSVVVEGQAFAVTRTVTTEGLPSAMKRVHVQVTWGDGQHYDAETIFSDIAS